MPGALLRIEFSAYFVREPPLGFYLLTEQVKPADSTRSILVRPYARVYPLDHLAEKDLAQLLLVHRWTRGSVRTVEDIELRTGVLFAQRHVGVVRLDPSA